MAGTLTEGLWRLIEAKPVARADLEQAALFVLDALANMQAGRHSEPGRILLEHARRLGRDAGREALTMGALIHILETDDLHRASVVHPGCVVVPAAYAIARREGAGGRRFLRAVLKGFEACCRVGMGVGPGHYRIWHNTATCGPFGSAYAAGDLIGLDAVQMVHALGNAGTQSAGLWEFLATGAMSKHLHAGRAAEAGVIAADLARLGFTGPPAILEGPKGLFAGACPDPRPEAVLAEPEQPWQLCLTSIKPWPSCRHTHPAIDAALELSARIAPEMVARVEVETYRAAIDVCDRPVANSEYEGKFSLQHCVATALTDGRVDFASFAPEARARLGDLAARVELRLSEPYASAYPRAWGSAVQVTMRDGNVLRAARQHAKGDPEAPLDAAAMQTKARMLLDHGSTTEPERFIARILALAEDGPLPDLADGPALAA
ncbi:MAG: MmgE/PrpD family protein [Alphaproteobacteria bacterium]|nr:MmgE/PrpD family protein [Alphaproteobacteria bacterium]